MLQKPSKLFDNFDINEQFPDAEEFLLGILWKYRKEVRGNKNNEKNADRDTRVLAALEEWVQMVEVYLLTRMKK